ncbi:ABC transporter substrate-binding protein [Paenibacillus eucommiae]|uniref:ABC-type glycerol-3-phosphate transport system substrate-binding protein n=1 Tax=Paenibacillus eucommiae TaxID=1355755 RepID=A0ABS4J848_9BACL|nr:ABC transporter substrate-binding protein [Paenibacillus eucommiae]MBP1995985.1 ABC-type glycerol-3-phosphate transport system substrate-binding protein [Paenibacillus eucommiae]
MKIKKLGMLLVVTLLVLSLLAGCASKDNKGSGTGTENVELTYWDAAWNEPVTPGIIKEFEEQNPGIKIKTEFFPDNGMQDKYLVTLKNNSGPDVINIAADWTAPFATAGGLLPLDDFIAKDKVDLEDFWPGALKTIQVKGKIYALPYRSETLGIFYNKSLFEKAGIDTTKAPETWEQVLDDAKKLTKDGTFGFGLVGKQPGNLSMQLITMIRTFGGDVLNEDYTKSKLSEPEAIAAAQFYVDLYKTHKVTPDSTMENDNAASRNLFSTEKVAMFISGNYDIDPINKANPNIRFGTGMAPYSKERKTVLGGWNVAITASSKKQEAAWKFVNFIASPEISVKYSNTFSSRVSAASNEKYQDPLIKPFLEGLKYATPMPAIPQMTQIRKIIHDNLQKAMIENVSVEEMMKATSQEVDKLLQK